MTIEGVSEKGFVTTTIETSSTGRAPARCADDLRPGLCAVEMMQPARAVRPDRFGVVFRPSPRQSDV